MKKNSVKIWAIYLLAAGSLMACGTQDIQTGNLNVIPLPQEIVETPSAAPFVINLLRRGQRETGRHSPYACRLYQGSDRNGSQNRN